MLTSSGKARRRLFLCRDVAQSGSALEWGSRGRRFKSFHPDQKAETPRDLRKRRSLFCFWDLPFPSFRCSCLPVLSRSRATRDKPSPPSPGPWMVPALANMADCRQSIVHKQKSHEGILRGFFRMCKKIRDRQTAAMLSATPLSPLSTGTKTSRDGPRVPFRLPSGKGACGNSGLRLHPAF